MNIPAKEEDAGKARVFFALWPEPALRRQLAEHGAKPAGRGPELLGHRLQLGIVAMCAKGDGVQDVGDQFTAAFGQAWQLSLGHGRDLSHRAHWLLAK